MEKIRHTCVLAAVMLIVSACATNKELSMSALNDAVGQATQEQLRQRWGDPTTMRPQPDGGARWTYERRETQPGNRYAAPGMWCEAYVLTFDRQTILRDWTHASHFHAGELMPQECVPSGSTHPAPVAPR